MMLQFTMFCSMAAGSISDVLVSDGRDVFLHHKRFNAALEKQQTPSRHLFSTSSLYAWRVDFPGRGRAIVKSGRHLFVAVMPTDILESDPHASYEGRRGGAVLVCGAVVAEQRRDSPAVWDGMAAANGRLYVATQDGRIRCLTGD